MGILYTGVAISFTILVIVNLTWIILNLVFWAFNGLQALLQGQNFFESLYYSTYLKWIILADVIWILIGILFAIKRKNYRADPDEFYFKKKPFDAKSICLVIPTYNEELAIGKLVSDFFNYKNVKQIIVVDNDSSDKTVEIAKKAGANVIKNKMNMGFAYSCVVGLQESLNHDVEIIGLVEGDGTCIANDLDKMVPYLEDADMVVGTRALQVLSEKGNQLGMLHNWGNYILAKLIQIKFFSLLHIGSVQLTDVGCLYRIIRKDSLAKIISTFTDPKTSNIIPGNEFTVFMTIGVLKNNLKLNEVPVTFKKRIGQSKIQSQKKLKAIKLGFIVLWYILKS